MVEPEVGPSRPGISARTRLSAWLPVILFECLVLFLSSRPHLHPPPVIPHLDKLVHFTEYACLGALLCRGLRMSGLGSGRALLQSCLLAALLGGADEWFQSAVPGRDASILDWMADCAGGALGTLLRLGLERGPVASGWTFPRPQ